MSLITPLINGDLKPEKRSGHISVFHRGVFIVFGGYGERHGSTNEYLISNHLWCYNVGASQWTRYSTKGEHPGNTTGSCACVLDDKLFLFAGYHQQNDSHTNRLHVLDLKTSTWTECTERTKGDRPSPRDKFACWKYKQKIIFFGGFGQPPVGMSTRGDFFFEELPDGYSRGLGWNNQLYELDCSEVLTWTQPTSKGDIPCPRAAFAVSQIGSIGYLFGGRFKDDRRNDMFSLNFDTYEWKQIKTPNDAPCGRSWHVMNPVSDNHLFLYGGLDSFGKTMKDVWILDIEKNEWSELRSATKYLACFAPRIWHTACNTDSPGEIVVFGGCSTSVFGTDLAIHTNTVALFRFSPLSLQRLCLDTIMRNFEKYSTVIEELPRGLQRTINYRCHALGFHSWKGHGKLINTCQIT